MSDEQSPLEELRSAQERELARSHALALMEYALAEEAFSIGIRLRESGIELDPLTYIVLRVLEAGLEELNDPVELLEVLRGAGSIDRSVDIATELLDAA